MKRRTRTVAFAAAVLVAFATEANAADRTQREAGLAGGSTTWGSGELAHANVSIGHLAGSLASDLKLDAQRIPATVQVPLDLAADLCGLDVHALLQQQKQAGTPSCTANTALAALKHAVLQQVRTAGTRQDPTGTSGQRRGAMPRGPISRGASEADPLRGGATGSAPPHPGRVAVDIREVAPELAWLLEVSQARLPSTVWLPAGLAADICGVQAGELIPPAHQAQPACTAASASPELQEALRIEMTTPGGQLR